jgi:hypothetical protein
LTKRDCFNILIPGVLQYIESDMAEKQQCVYLFHLFRKDGTSLVLHPFSSPDRLTAVLGSAAVQGRYGNEPRVEALTLFRNRKSSCPLWFSWLPTSSFPSWCAILCR